MDNAAVTSLCPQRHKHSPPTTRVPSTALPPLLPLPSVTLSPAIIWLNSRERASSRIFFLGGEVISHSAIPSMFFFLLNRERTRRNLFRKSFDPHQSSCMPTTAARERCLCHFPKAKTSHASERQPPTPRRPHYLPGASG